MVPFSPFSESSEDRSATANWQRMMRSFRYLRRIISGVDVEWLKQQPGYSRQVGKKYIYEQAFVVSACSELLTAETWKVWNERRLAMSEEINWREYQRLLAWAIQLQFWLFELKIASGVMRFGTDFGIRRAERAVAGLSKFFEASAPIAEEQRT